MITKLSAETNRQASPENKRAIKFKKNDVITCPSDGTGIQWKVVHIGPDGTIFAQVKKNQQYPSLNYPEQIEITKEAKNKWQKIA